MYANELACYRAAEPSPVGHSSRLPLTDNAYQLSHAQKPETLMPPSATCATSCANGRWGEEPKSALLCVSLNAGSSGRSLLAIMLFSPLAGVGARSRSLRLTSPAQPSSRRSSDQLAGAWAPGRPCKQQTQKAGAHHAVSLVPATQRSIGDL